MYWGYVIAGYGIVGVGLAAYAIGVIRAGRSLSRQVPPERRRFLD